MLEQLAKSIRVTKTLVKLVLSHNGLKSPDGILIVDALIENLTISHIDVNYNELGDLFAKALSNCLKHNEILHTVDISNNPVFNYVNISRLEKREQMIYKKQLKTQIRASAHWEI